jgi:hypothetical protein
MQNEGHGTVDSLKVVTRLAVEPHRLGDGDNLVGFRRPQEVA